MSVLTNIHEFWSSFSDEEQDLLKALKNKDYTSLMEVLQGLDQEAADCARALLSENSLTPLQIVETCLIPALDETGKKFEAGTMYLPQLLAAASASQAVFEVLKEEMAKSGSQKLDRGTIILATVHGDVHDIGKNIVKTVLENYGFDIIDLGKDVPAQVIADAALQNGGTFCFDYHHSSGHGRNHPAFKAAGQSSKGHGGRCRGNPGVR